jgi:hypothetical protein
LLHSASPRGQPAGWLFLNFYRAFNETTSSPASVYPAKVSQRDLNWNLLACELQVSFAYLVREGKVAGDCEIATCQAIDHIGF